MPHQNRSRTTGPRTTSGDSPDGRQTPQLNPHLAIRTRSGRALLPLVNGGTSPRRARSQTPVQDVANPLSTGRGPTTIPSTAVERSTNAQTAQDVAPQPHAEVKAEEAEVEAKEEATANVKAEAEVEAKEEATGKVKADTDVEAKEEATGKVKEETDVEAKEEATGKVKAETDVESKEEATGKVKEEATEAPVSEERTVAQTQWATIASPVAAPPTSAARPLRTTWPIHNPPFREGARIWTRNNGPTRLERQNAMIWIPIETDGPLPRHRTEGYSYVRAPRRRNRGADVVPPVAPVAPAVVPVATSVAPAPVPVAPAAAPGPLGSRVGEDEDRGVPEGREVRRGPSPPPQEEKSNGRKRAREDDDDEEENKEAAERGSPRARK